LSSASLFPSIVAHRVDGAARDKVNLAEADAVASLVAAAIESRAYVGKSMGVVSMVGDEQALEIERRIREHISPVEFERRRILCGSAAHFQGDERDVMFLSMVDSAEGSPLALRQHPMFKQRFNVAASRARDQMWVVHSLDIPNDLKADDLRRRLLEHCLEPAAARGAPAEGRSRPESALERAVLDRLARAGYLVTPQWEVGNYRIDLVVGGSDRDRRLAVECDGDRHHTRQSLENDMVRQEILERLGWRFIRVRGSAFYRDPDAAMEPVFSRLKDLGIEPRSAEAMGAPGESPQAVSAELVRRAKELLRDWKGGNPSRAAKAPDGAQAKNATNPPASSSRRGTAPRGDSRGRSAAPRRESAGAQES